MIRPASDLIEKIDALLPQTQCRQCGYAGCRPYAEAIAAGRAGINQCPPGGGECVSDLAALLGVGCVPVDPRFGVTKPPAVAAIDETLCIGCTLCIEACPVDAIAGAAKLMHTVIARDCTGCELCIIACPADCISLVPVVTIANRVHATLGEREPQASLLRRQYESHKARFAERAEAIAEVHAPKVLPDKKALLADILARAKARK